MQIQIYSMLDYNLKQIQMQLRLKAYIMPVIMKLSHYIYVMDRGNMIAEGLPEEVANNQKVIESYLGNGIEVEEC